MTRIYTDGSSEPSTLSNLSWMLAGVAVGATLMYLFDPHSGNRRRAMMLDKANSASRKARKMVDATATDLGNRAQGMRHKAEHWIDAAATELERTGAARRGAQRHDQGQHMR
jgi:gas vesicle protein